MRLFEYDWSGVIIGPDLIVRDGRFVSVRGANGDPAFRNQAAVTDGLFDQLVRHIYKVLLTRGMVGTVLYATDKETQEFLFELVERAPRALGLPGVGAASCRCRRRRSPRPRVVARTTLRAATPTRSRADTWVAKTGRQ